MDDLYTTVKLRRKICPKNIYDPDSSSESSSPERRIKNKSFSEPMVPAAVTRRRGRKRADETVTYEFQVGDLVWGKIAPHPWWPGQVYDPAQADEEAMSTWNGDDHMAVFLYGDSTHGWIRPNHLLPFVEHFAAKSSIAEDDPIRRRAVNEALEEVKRRSIMGLVCRCQDVSGLASYGDVEDRLIEVDFGGFMDGRNYSGRQLKEAREAIQPEEMTGFLQRLAVNPRNAGEACSGTIDLVTYTSQLQFYRKQRSFHKDLNEQDDGNYDSLASWEAEADEQAGDPLPDRRWCSPLPKKPSRAVPEKLKRGRGRPKKPKQEAVKDIIRGPTDEFQKPRAPNPEKNAVKEIIRPSNDQLQFANTGDSSREHQLQLPEKPATPAPKDKAVDEISRFSPTTNELQYSPMIGGSATATGGSSSVLQSQLPSKPQASAPKGKAVMEISSANEPQRAIITGSTNGLQIAGRTGSSNELQRRNAPFPVTGGSSSAAAGSSSMPPERAAAPGNRGVRYRRVDPEKRERLLYYLKWCDFLQAWARSLE